MANESEIVMLFPSTIQVSKIAEAQSLNEKLCTGVYSLMKTQPNTKPDS